MNIAEVREKYPQYEDLNDQDLARALHAKFYSDLDFEDFSKRIGVQQEEIGALDALSAGFKRGIKQPLEGLMQIGAEQSLPAFKARFDELQQGLVSGQIPLTPENIARRDSLLEQVSRLETGLESSFEREQQARQDMSSISEQAPISAFVGQAAGQLAGLPIPAAGVASTLGGRVLQGSATGSAFGTVQPRVEGEGVAEQAVTGAVLGGLAPAVLEKAVAPVVGVVAQKIFNYPRLSAAQRKIVSELQKNPRNPDFAKFAIIDGKPKATTELKNAIRQFGSAEPIAVIKASSPTDKRAIKKMVDIVSRVKKDPLLGDKVRVGDVVGKSLKNRVLGIKTLLETSGKQIDRVARKQLKGKQVNIASAKNSFKSALDNLRIGYEPSTGSVNFEGSALEGAGGAQARDLVKRMALRLKDDVIDAQDVHFAKRLIDQKTAFGSSERGLAGEIESAIKGLRANLNQSLRDSFPAYAKANQKYSDSIDALNSFQDAAGSKLNLDDPKALGVKARSFTNNSLSRARLAESLDNMQDVLAKYGIRFKDDISTQVFAANAIEERFKTSGSTTFQSEIAKAGRDVVAKGVRETIIDKAADLAEKIKGVNDDEAIKALLKILGE